MIHFPMRKTNRLQGYDYSQNGAYFITVCTKNKQMTLGTIESNSLDKPVIWLSDSGEIARRFIESISITGSDVYVPNYIIMPNHIHLILVAGADDEDGTPRAASPTKALIPKTINALKGLSSKKAGFSMWQRSYYDHIIRNDEDYARIDEYITNNLASWQADRFYTP